MATNIDQPQELATGSTLAVRSKAWSPKTPEDREVVLQQLERVLNSSVFRSSKRYPALLKFIVEQTLDGRVDAIKERILGIEVFGRPADYDTNSDHVVRTAAGEIRKRLAQYYMEPGRETELRIDVPSGSYVPTFKYPPEYPPYRPAMSPVVVEAAPVTAIDRLLRWRLPVGVSIVAVAFIFVAFGGARLIGGLVRGETTLQKFWDPVFASPTPVLMCVGIRDARPQPPQPTAPAVAPAGATPLGQAINTDPLMRRVAMADVLTLARLTAYAGQRGAAFRVLNPVSTSFGDLRTGPTILIGVGNNDWTQQLAGKLRFNYELDKNYPRAIHDTQNPLRADWVAAGLNPEGTYKDYAMVSRLLDPRVEQVVVIVGGLGPHGTEMAGEFVVNPAYMKKLEAYAPAGWAGKNLQVVLSTEVVKGSSGPPKIEAAYFW